MIEKEELERLKNHYKQDKKEDIKKLFGVDIPLSQDRNYETEMISKAFDYLLDELANYFFIIAQK